MISFHSWLDYDKYNNDQQFHKIVCGLRNHMIEGLITQEDILSAAKMAIRQFETHDHER